MPLNFYATLSSLNCSLKTTDLIAKTALALDNLHLIEADFILELFIVLMLASIFPLPILLMEGPLDAYTPPKNNKDNDIQNS
jgi:hypothetical protein